MPFKRYRSTAAAERAKNRIERDVPQARVEINDDLGLVIWCYPEALTPAQRESIEAHDVRRPAAPSPRSPMFAPVKKPPASQWSHSTVENPAAVCVAIFERYRAEGRLDDRASAMREALAAGVNPNTAKTYYARYRERVGLPKSVRVVRRRLKARSPIKLSAKPPEGRRVCNGQQEPATNTRTREIWDMCDVLHRKLGRPPALGEVRQRLPGRAANSVTKGYQAWRRFHAIPPQGQYHKRG